MGIWIAIFIVALGAILAFAVDVQLSGLDLNVVGWILMVVGLFGLVLSLMLWFDSMRRRANEVRYKIVRRNRDLYNDEDLP